MKNEIIALPQEVAQIAENVSIEKKNEVQTVLNQVFNGVSKMREQLDTVVIENENDKVNMKLANTIRLGVRQVRLEAEKKAEQERIEKEKALTIHNERKEQLLPYWGFLTSKKRTEELSTDFSTFTENEWKEIFDWCVLEKKKDDDIKETQRKENERLKAEAEKQRAEKAKLEAELRSKQLAEAEAEAKRKAEILAEEKAKILASKAPRKEKLTKWVDSFQLPNFEQDEKATEIMAKFEAFKKWAKNEIESI